MAEKIVKLLYYPFLNIFYFLSMLLPKNKQKWIFGAWYGQRYGDNSKYLFEYVCQNRPEIRAIWISKKRAVVSRLKRSGRESHFYLSLKGIYHTLTSKVAVLTCGKEDINNTLISPTHFKVQLWHGVGYKKIMYDDKMSGDLYTRTTKIKHIFFPFIKPTFDMVIATSPETQRQFSSAFRLPKEKVPITGYPRNDIFFEKKSLSDDKPGKIIYAPTHRGEGKGKHIKKILPNPREFEELNQLLHRLDAILYFRLHYYDADYLPPLEKYSQIAVSDRDDIQELLFETGILITDYSSIYFDYLLLDRPIIFTPFDLEDYLQSEREFHFRYEDVTPGPIARNWAETFQLIEEEIKNPERYKKQRKKIRKLFYQYRDGFSSERVIDEIYRRIS
jgi:CDP-glycerol glycerophosphotransferase (TagB/SpsB family)